MRPIVIVTPGAVPARDLPLGLRAAEEVLLLAPAGWSELPLALLSSLGQVVALPAEPTLTPELLETCRTFAPTGVAVLSEHAIVFAVALAIELGLPVLGDAAPLTDKLAQRSALSGVDRTLSVPVESSSNAEAILAAVGAPLVLKPVAGRGSRSTFVVSDARELRARVDAILSRSPDERLAAEEFLRGRPSGRFGSFVSVESFVVDGRITHFGVTGKLPQLAPFRETSHIYPAPLDAEERHQVEVLARDAVAAVGVRNGATHTEIKLTSAGPRIIEINGRLGGYINELYGRVLGANVVEMAMRAACGEEVTPPEPPPDRVFYNYSHQPPHGATRLVDVVGMREARDVPGVVRYDALTRPGSELPDDSRSLDLNLVSGEADDFRAMFDQLDEVHDRLTFTFLRHGEEVALSGRELAGQQTSDELIAGLSR